MKEVYEAPQVDLFSYVSVEDLASSSVDRDDLLLGGKPADYDSNDIGLNF